MSHSHKGISKGNKITPKNDCAIRMTDVKAATYVHDSWLFEETDDPRAHYGNIMIRHNHRLRPQQTKYNTHKTEQNNK